MNKKSSKKKPREKLVVKTLARKSERLQKKCLGGLFSCPVCFETFEEVSDVVVKHFEAHYE